MHHKFDVPASAALIFSNTNRPSASHTALAPLLSEAASSESVRINALELLCLDHTWMLPVLLSFATYATNWPSGDHAAVSIGAFVSMIFFSASPPGVHIHSDPGASSDVNSTEASREETSTALYPSLSFRGAPPKIETSQTDAVVCTPPKFKTIRTPSGYHKTLFTLSRISSGGTMSCTSPVSITWTCNPTPSAYARVLPSGEIASLKIRRSGPFRVSCFSESGFFGDRSSSPRQWYVAPVPITSSAINATAAYGPFRPLRCLFSTPPVTANGGCAERLTWRAELVSRARRFKSARISLACWYRMSRSFSIALLMIRPSSAGAPGLSVTADTGIRLRIES